MDKSKKEARKPGSLSQNKWQKIVKETQKELIDNFVQIASIQLVTDYYKQQIKQVLLALKQIVISSFHFDDVPNEVQKTIFAFEKYIIQKNKHIFQNMILKLHALLINEGLEMVHNDTYEGALEWEKIKYHQKTNRPTVTQDLVGFGQSLSLLYFSSCVGIMAGSLHVQKIYKYFDYVIKYIQPQQKRTKSEINETYIKLIIKYDPCNVEV